MGMVVVSGKRRKGRKEGKGRAREWKIGREGRLEIDSRVKGERDVLLFTLVVYYR
jgi:hypothetical protein